MNPCKWKTYSKEELENIVKNNVSYSGVATALGYRVAGSNIQTIKEMVSFHNLDTSHFLGRSSNLGKIDFDKFVDGRHVPNNSVLVALISLRGRECECCHQKVWMGKDIPLEVHHIDGNNWNSLLSNLQMLCPNCHAQTETWRGRNIDKPKAHQISDEEFSKALVGRNVRQALLHLGLSPRGGNYSRAKKLLNK